MKNNEYAKIAGVAIGILLTTVATALATEIRLMGMGDVEFIIDDDTNRNNLYRWGDNVSGILRDEDSSRAQFNLSWARQKSRTNGISDSLKYVSYGQPFPKSLLEYTPFDYLANLLEFPVFDMPGNNFSYIDRKSGEERNPFGETIAPQAYGIDVSYSAMESQLDTFSQTLRTPQVNFIYCKEISDLFSWGLHMGGFWGKLTASGEDGKISLTNYDGGIGAGFHVNKDISLGLTVDGNLPIFKAASGSQSLKYTGPGYKVGMQAIGNLNRATLLVKGQYSDVKTKGTWEQDKSPIGKFSTNGRGANAKVLYQLPVIPATLGLVADYNAKESKEEDEDSAFFFHSKVSSFTVAGGLNIKIPYGLLGLEYAVEAAHTDEISIDTSYTDRKGELRIGAEFKAWNTIFLRSGFVVGKEDPDVDQMGDMITYKTVTAGIGLQLLSRLEADVAYNHKTLKRTNDLDQKDIAQNIAALTVKWEF